MSISKGVLGFWGFGVLGVCGWMLNFCFWDFVVASQEARLGNRFSNCIVASRVWGCVGGC